MHHLIVRTSQNIIRNAGLTYSMQRAAAAASPRRSLSTTSNNGQEFRDSEDLAKERYDMRANEDVDKKRARLLYQSRKRGMLENGVILASFANKYLAGFNPEQLDIYDRLINLPTNDWDIFHWATNTKPTPPEFETTVMKDLREHIKSKVSTREIHKDSDGKEVGEDNLKKHEIEVSVLGKTNPDDIVLPATKRKYELDINPSNISLVDYEEELFDNSIQRLPNNNYMQSMTEWRKKFFVKRLRRTIPSPISLRNLGDDKPTEAFSQRSVAPKNIANESMIPQHLYKSPTERAMSHHNFLQHLLKSEFTDDARDYDDEAEAWSEMMWRQDYGFADVRVAPSQVKCFVCQARLHCCDPGLDGYLPKELFPSNSSKSPTNEGAICQRCKFSQAYSASLGCQVSEKAYEDVLHKIKMSAPSIICLLIDLTDFPSGLYENLIARIGNHHRVLIVGNKLDLLPVDGSHMRRRVLYTLRKNLSKLNTNSRNMYINDVILLSARTGFNVESLVTRLLVLTEVPKNIYLLGSSNSGKSTLFNALLQSDLSAIREGDLVSRVSSYELPQGTNLLKFPIAWPEGWQVEMKRRKMERVERNEDQMDKTFQNAVEFRQANAHHTSNLIDRFEYQPLPASHLDSSLETQPAELKHDGQIVDANAQLKFSADHPLRIHQDKFSRAALCATEEQFPGHSFFHQTPSVSTRDQLHDLLTIEERLDVFPNETIVPRNYSLRPLQSIFIAGLARLDLMTSTSNVIFTIFVSKHLPIHVVPTRKADNFYYTFLGSSYLGVPYGDLQRIRDWPRLESSRQNFNVKGVCWDQGAQDIVLSSIGWAMVRVYPDQECIIKVFTPEGRGISSRQPPLLCYGHRQDGRKIRDTPLFQRPQYSSERVPA